MNDLLSLKCKETKMPLYIKFSFINTNVIIHFLIPQIPVPMFFRDIKLILSHKIGKHSQPVLWFLYIAYHSEMCKRKIKYRSVIGDVFM